MANREFRSLFVQEIRPIQARNLELVASCFFIFYRIELDSWLNCFQVHVYREEQVPLHPYFSGAVTPFQGAAAGCSLHSPRLQLWILPQILHFPWFVLFFLFLSGAFCFDGCLSKFHLAADFGGN